MSGNVAYGQTDVMHDRKWIIANMAGRRPNDPVRLQMEAALASLNQEEARGMQEKHFGIAQAGLEENRQQRFETARANRESRELYQQGLKDTREERTQIARDAREAQRAQGLQLAMHDPDLNKEERQAAKQQYLASLGVAAAPNAAGAKKGEYGPGGAPATPPVTAVAGAPVTGATPAAAGGGYIQPTAAFTGQGAAPPQTGGKRYVSPQELSPPPGSSPGAFEHAVTLRKMVASGEATTGEIPASPLANPAFANAGPVGYAPDLGANVVANQAGERMAVGAPDTSVGALRGSQIRDLGATRRGNEYELATPSGGTIRSTYKGAFGNYAAAHPEYRNVTGQTPGQIAGREPIANPVPQERDMGGNLFTPPTPAFATGEPAPQPVAIPTTAPAPAPGKIQVGFAGQPPIDIGSVSYTGGISNAAQDVAAALARPPIAYGPMSNQAQDAAARLVTPKVGQQPPLVPPPKPVKKKEQT